MRQDARTLLERLNRQDFRYREFPDQFTDMELWPLFEALLTDDRVVGGRDALRGADMEVRERRPQAQPQTQNQTRQPTERPALGKRESQAPSRPGLFNRYGGRSPKSEPENEGGNLRQFLGRLADKD